MTLLALSAIRTNGGTQPRAHISEEAVGDYSEAFQAGDQFPAVVVFFDGSQHWLADGFHRVAAALKAGREEIEADVRQGQQRDAVLFCLGANADPRGLRRTNEDKRRAVLTMLRDEEWKQWSNVEIAKRCSVGEHMVRELRGGLSSPKAMIEDTRKVTRNGTTYTQKVRPKAANGQAHAGAATAQKAAERVAKQSTNGKPVFDDREVETLLGKLVRAFHARAEAFGADAAFEDLNNQAELLIQAWKRWQLQTTGRK